MTSACHCRIGKIKPKSGGEVRLLPDIRAQEGERLMRDLQWYVQQQVKDSFSPDELAGFAVVVWGRDGGHSTYHSMNTGSTVTDTTLPTFVREAFRRRIATGDAHTAIDERLVE